MLAPRPSRAHVLVLLLAASVVAAGSAAGASPVPAAGLESPPGAARAPGVVLAALLATLLAGLDAFLSLVAAQLRPLARLLPGLGFVPLFSRIDGKDILDNQVRQRIHDAIRDDPGLSMADLQGRAGVAWGTAVYHLYRLERGGLVVSVRHGSARRYFAANTPFARKGRELAALRHPTVRRIAYFVHANPGVDQASLCKGLGLLNPIASKHLGRLALLGLVTKQRAGRHRLYRATPELETALVIAPRPGAPATPQPAVPPAGTQAPDG